LINFNVPLIKDGIKRLILWVLVSLWWEVFYH